MFRIDRHELGPRVYVFRRRVHEYQLGLGILVLLAIGALPDWVRANGEWSVVAVLAIWLVAKDWRDLVPSQRDTAAWRLGFHRRPDAD